MPLQIKIAPVTPSPRPGTSTAMASTTSSSARRLPIRMGGRSGSAYVVFGGASGFPPNIDLSTLNGSNGFKINGVAAGDESGFSVDSAGDLNFDGFADLIVGAYLTDPNGTSSGTSYVIYGRMPDTAVTRVGTNASQTLAGGNFADTLSGLGGDDELFGHDGDDILTGGAGDDTLRGGEGSDTAIYTGDRANYTITYNSATQIFTLLDNPCGLGRHRYGDGYRDFLVQWRELHGGGSAGRAAAHKRRTGGGEWLLGHASCDRRRYSSYRSDGVVAGRRSFLRFGRHVAGCRDLRQWID